MSLGWIVRDRERAMAAGVDLQEDLVLQVLFPEDVQLAYGDWSSSRDDRKSWDELCLEACQALIDRVGGWAESEWENWREDIWGLFDDLVNQGELDATIKAAGGEEEEE